MELTLHAAVSPGALTFLGSGRIALSQGADYATHGLISQQVSLPARVPVGQVINTWTMAGAVQHLNPQCYVIHDIDDQVSSSRRVMFCTQRYYQQYSEDEASYRHAIIESDYPRFYRDRSLVATCTAASPFPYIIATPLDSGAI